MLTTHDLERAGATKGAGKLPYRMMLTRYRAQLKTETDPKRKVQLETIIIALLGMIEMQEKLDDIIERLARLEL